MKSNQKLAIMFWLKSSKATKDGLAPLYARITISGKYEDISLSKKVNPKFSGIASLPSGLSHFFRGVATTFIRPPNLCPQFGFEFFEVINRDQLF